VEGDVPGRAEELGVLAEVEYAAVGGGHAVARGGDGGGTRGRGGEGELDRSGTGAAEWWWPVEPWSHGIGTAGRLTHGRRVEGVDGRRPGTGGEGHGVYVSLGQRRPLDRVTGYDVQRPGQHLQDLGVGRRRTGRGRHGVGAIGGGGRRGRGCGRLRVQRLGRVGLPLRVGGGQHIGGKGRGL